jgi:hypothetical protein
MSAFQLVVVDPSFSTNENVTQKGITCFMIPIQKAVPDIETVTSMLFPELFWNLPYTNFIEA